TCFFGVIRPVEFVWVVAWTGRQACQFTLQSVVHALRLVTASAGAERVELTRQVLVFWQAPVVPRGERLVVLVCRSPLWSLLVTCHGGTRAGAASRCRSR